MPEQTSKNITADETVDLDPAEYGSIIFFTGAGMSAECGVPTYRGAGGIWESYNWKEVACQRAFEQDPEKVLDFHELRRAGLFNCRPHAGHEIIARLQRQHSDTRIVTQNIDGMHQRAGTIDVLELHGNIWRLRCKDHGTFEDYGKSYTRRHCPQCGKWLRPDITWFEDMLDPAVLAEMESLMKNVNLFIAVGTSGLVYPAAIFPQLAQQVGARTVCINTEEPDDASFYDDIIMGRASEILTRLFNTR